MRYLYLLGSVWVGAQQEAKELLDIMFSKHLAKQDVVVLFLKWYDSGLAY